MRLEQTAVSPAVKEAIKDFEGRWSAAEAMANDDERLASAHEVGCEAWDRLMAIPCATAADVVAKCSAFLTYRQDEKEWDAYTLNDADFPLLANIFKDARRISGNLR